MQSALHCIPRFVSQGRSVARLAADDPQVHERVVREGLRRASQADLAKAREPDSTTENNRKRKDKVMTPMGDGTGPFGQGPAGKGRGPCGGGQRRGWGGGRGQGGQGRGRGGGRGFGRGRGRGGVMPQNPAAASAPTEKQPD